MGADGPPPGEANPEASAGPVALGGDAGGGSEDHRLAARGTRARSTPAVSGDDAVRVRYNLAIAYLNLSYFDGAPNVPGAPVPGDALASAEQYCREVIDLVLGSASEEITASLAGDLRPQAAMLLASIGASQGLARPGARAAAKRALTDHSTGALRALVAGDGDPSHLDLALWAVGAMPSPDAGSAYNAACYWSKVGSFDDALSSLAIAVVEPILCSHAHEDPALARLRTERSDDFAALVPVAASKGDETDGGGEAALSPPAPRLATAPAAFDLSHELIADDPPPGRRGPWALRGWLATGRGLPARVDVTVRAGAGEQDGDVLEVEVWSTTPLDLGPITVSALVVAPGAKRESEELDLSGGSSPALRGFRYRASTDFRAPLDLSAPIELDVRRFGVVLASRPSSSTAG